MFSKSRIYTLFSYSFIAIVIAFAPLIIGRLHRDVDPLEPMRSEKSQWIGVIEMWNTCYVKASKGSQVAWLESCAIERFELENQGVYIRTFSVDQDRLSYELSLSEASGEFPDIVSLPPTGKGDFESIPFEENSLVLAEKKIKSFINNDKTGIPWAVGSYVYMVNKDLCAENNLQFVDYPSILAEFNQYNQIDNVKAFLFPMACEEQIAETINQHQLSNIEFIPDSDYYRMFLKNNQSVAAIVPLRTYFMAETLQTDGKINQFEAQQAPDWINNNQICRLGLIKQKDNQKKDICFKFLSHLLSNEVQQEINRIGMFPVKKGITVYESGLLSEIERIQQK